MSEFFESLKEYYKRMTERLKTPFVLTFITVWIIRHWTFVLLLFSGGATLTADRKICELRTYIDNQDKWTLFWNPLGYAALSVIGYFLANLLYEVIFEGYSRWARPAILWIINRNKIVKRSEYENLLDEKDELLGDYKKLEKDYDYLRKYYNDLEADMEDLEEKHQEAVTSKESLETANKELLKIKGEYDKVKGNENNFLWGKTRYAMLDLLKFINESPAHNLANVPVTNIFFGHWLRATFVKEGNSSEVEQEISFEGNLIKTKEGEFFGNIISVRQAGQSSVYMVEFKIREQAVPEVLIRLEKTLIIGYNRQSKYVVQYQYIGL